MGETGALTYKEKSGDQKLVLLYHCGRIPWNQVRNRLRNKTSEQFPPPQLEFPDRGS